jgi:hypothetical protein
MFSTRRKRNMSSDPKAAYEAVKAKRAKNEAAREKLRIDQDELPTRAEAKLKVIDARLREVLPEGLSIETSFTSAGKMDRPDGRRGLKGLHLKFLEAGTVFAEATIDVGADTSVEVTDQTVASKPRLIELKAFAYLKDEEGVDVLSELITRHLK